MQLIFDTASTEIVLLNKNEMTTLDQGSNGEKFENFIADATKDEAEEKNLENNHKDINMDDSTLDKGVSNESNNDDAENNGGITANQIEKEKTTCELMTTKETVENGILVEPGQDILKQDRKIDNIENAQSTKSSAAICEMDTIESTMTMEPTALTTDEKLIESTDEKLIESKDEKLIESNDEKVIEEDKTPNNIDMEQHSEDIPTAIAEETIEKKSELTSENDVKVESLPVDKSDCAALEATSNDESNLPSIEEKPEDDSLENCLAGAGDCIEKDLQIKEKESIVNEKVYECPTEPIKQTADSEIIETKKENIELDVKKELVPDVLVENDNMDIDKIENVTENDKPMELLEKELCETIHDSDKKDLIEKLDEVQKEDMVDKILDESLDEGTPVMSSKDSDNQLSLNSKSSVEKLETVVESCLDQDESMAEKSVKEKSQEKEISLEKTVLDVSSEIDQKIKKLDKLSSESIVENIAMETEPSLETIVENISSSEAVETESQEATPSDDVVDATTEPAVVESSDKDNTSVSESIESIMTPLETIIEEPISSISIAQKPSKTDEALESMNLDDVDMERDISDKSKENISVDSGDNQSFVTATSSIPVDDNDDISIVDDNVKVVVDKSLEKTLECEKQSTTSKPVTELEQKKDTFKLSNSMDILSDDEEETSKQDKIETSRNAVAVEDSQEKQTINIDDDDDIMVIDDDTNLKSDNKDDSPAPITNNQDDTIPVETIYSKVTDVKKSVEDEKKEPTPEPSVTAIAELPIEKTEKSTETVELDPKQKKKSLVPENFFKSYKKNLSSMTRDDLEEFCILKIVESIIDRSTLNEINAKLKAITQTAEEYKKKALSMIKQHRDLQVVLKSVQEEQKNHSTTPIAPLKITRSVGMQVLMTDKNRRRPVPVSAPGSMPVSAPGSNINVGNNSKPKTKPKPAGRPPKPPPTPVVNTIPVPRLVPASNAASKGSPLSVGNNSNKQTPMSNGVKNSPPPVKPEKRTHSRMQSLSFTVDLTDDEPPAKIVSKSPGQPVRLVPPQNLMAARGQSFSGNSPRKVFIPISGPGTQQLRPGQTIMVKNVPQGGPRQRNPNVTVRGPQTASRMPRPPSSRHPAPLPDAMKQYQPPNWKALPPAPDLKLSKVENGIVISWKIDGYQEDSYEEIASYQLFAYQETATPPNTNLWKKIGDVKALPLPMACTLTQFMAGFKYYFAVRAVDVRSRLGPFSMPGSILLLNKM